ncbi:hypothetical protein V1478_003264 [Vespula squamosa]|uniref:Uncharacterized protein n=1 Tax=Vespula squamosa TaxID=30214 RepID=A0ABD2BS71_VESSQ
MLVAFRSKSLAVSGIATFVEVTNLVSLEENQTIPPLPPKNLYYVSDCVTQQANTCLIDVKTKIKSLTKFEY